MPRKPQKSDVETKRPFKAYTPFSDDELEQIDEWRFAQHIANRSAAVRRLVLRGLVAEGVRSEGRR